MITRAFLTFPDSGLRTGKKQDGNNYIPNPSTYTVGMEDIDLDSKRSTSAIMHRNRVRKNAYVIKCGWDILTELQLYKLLSALQEEHFSIVFRDPLNIESKYTELPKVYAMASKEATLVKALDDDNEYWSINMEFIEI